MPQIGQRTMLDKYEDANPSVGRATATDFDLVRERLKERPESLSVRDEAILQFFGGARSLDQARAARDAATRPSPTLAVSGESKAHTHEPRREDESLTAWVRRTGSQNNLVSFFALAAAVDHIDDQLAVLDRFAAQVNERNRERNAKIASLETKVAALEAHQMHDAGVWESGKEYAAGAIVSHNGSAWLCRAAHISVGGAPSPDYFRMFVKHGRDAR